MAGAADPLLIEQRLLIGDGSLHQGDTPFHFQQMHPSRFMVGCHYGAAAEHLVDESVKPVPGGSVSLMLTPLELIERLAALIPPPRRHRHRTAPGASSDSEEQAEEEALLCRAARYAWALLLARIYEVFPLVCPRCGGEMRIIAFLSDAGAVREIRSHWDEPTSLPPIAPARGPPLWEITDADQGEFDPPAQPTPDYEFDQRIAW